MKKGVLLLQMGGPCCKHGVRSFLLNLFSDPFLIQLPFFLKPFQKLLAKIITNKRVDGVIEKYEEIGGGSPILFETQCQAKALEKFLNKNSSDQYQCFIAMRYSYPFLQDTIKQIKQANITSLDVIPLYPQYSKATTGSSFWECEKLFKENDISIATNYIESWQENQYFVELIKNRIIDSLENFNETRNEKIQVLFSAHGLPQRYVDQGDPYQKQIEASCQAIINVLDEKYKKRIDWQITYQSRVGPEKWLEPNTEDVLEELGKTAKENVLIVPISFVGDHIETLHELGIEYKEVAIAAGVKNYHVTRLPKANTLLIQALADTIGIKQKEIIPV